MTYRQSIKATAEKYIGQRHLYIYPWCCKFIQRVYSEAGLSSFWYDGKNSLSCTTVLNWYKNNKPLQVILNKEALRTGDIVFLNFKNNGKPNHVGIYIGPAKNGFYTIEGNTSGDSEGKQYTGDTCALKVRKYSQVFAFVHIIFPGENPYPQPTRTLYKGLKGVDVKWLQHYLAILGYAIAVDGSFGAKTEVALKDAQAKLSLDSDGRCGPATRQTLKELFEK